MLKNLNKKVRLKIKLIFESLFSGSVYLATNGIYPVFLNPEIKDRDILVNDIVYSLFVVNIISSNSFPKMIKHRENLSTNIDFFKILSFKNHWL